MSTQKKSRSEGKENAEMFRAELLVGVSVGGTLEYTSEGGAKIELERTETHL
jgi:hypothetical protein